MLRDYQLTLKADIYAAWQDPRVRNVIATMATGGGKTVVECAILQEFNAPAVVMAHRSELVSQLALALNREQIPHSIIAPKPIIAQVNRLEIDTHGRSYYNHRAPVRVASAHTLALRDAKDRWYQQCALAIVDEGHHVTKDTVWSRSLDLLPNARGLFKTAHAVRADGAGLGRHADGLADALVVGPCGRDLIDRGYLCDYTVRVPPNDVDISAVPIGPSGEYVHDKLCAAVHASGTIVGNIVEHYLRFAGGKLGLTFAVDIQAANEIRAEYERRGVPAEVITAKTPIPVRAALMRRFRARQLLQLVSVDVLSEGVDVPAVEVVSLGRHTASWQLMCQQIGRVLRVDAPISDQMTDAQRLAVIAASTKPQAIILDHVDNIRRHHAVRGMFDSLQRYTLDRRERKSRKPLGVVPLRSCLECFKPYESHLLVCPHCMTAKPAPARRGTPEQVEGDLFELDLSTLKQMRGELARVDGPARMPNEANAAARASIEKNHLLRHLAQATLRATIATWAGWKKAGLQDREIQRLFFHTFAVDVMTAQTLGHVDAAELERKINSQLEAANVVAV